MRRLAFTITFLPAMFLTSLLVAQDPVRSVPARGPSTDLDQVAQTENMWFYLQELRRHDDPDVIIHQKAQRKADQRRNRLAAMKWFGWSQSRPTANPTPTMGVYSPSWVGNGVDPYHWIGNAYLSTAIRIDTDSGTRR